MKTQPQLLMRVLFTFFTFFLFSCVSFAQVNLNNGLVAFYPFNGNAIDASGNNHNAQAMNGIGLTTDRFGNSNSAYLFDGIDDYIKVPDNGAFSTPQFSLVLWFQTYSNDLQNLIAKRDFNTLAGSGGAQYQFFINYPPYPGVGSNIVGNNSTCTTTAGSSYLNTTDWICINKWHFAVVTFDGSSHKIYIDGVLKKEATTAFNGMLSCKSDLRFGNWFTADLIPFKGKMDDIRWYNRALNPQEITALYDNFPNLFGTCTNDAGAGFLAPDTVCINTPVTIANTSVGASKYYWNFCVANSSTNPDGTNLGDFGFSLSVFVDYAKDGNNYYAFVTNNFPGKLVRLDFGNSLLNTPVAHDFGNLGGVIPNSCEGIQVVQNEGRWYAIIVGDQPVGRIVKIDFGSSLSNDSPIATNWGNIGNLAYPTDLHLFQNGNEWYGLTLNSQTNSITRFNFTNSFTNIPTGTNLGNIGGLNYPTGIYAIGKNGSWYAFVSNEGGDRGDLPTASLTRLDFGNSLLNTPTGTNLGNPGNTFRSARDLTIYQSCNEIFGFVVNYSSANDIVRLNFNGSLTSVPTAVSLGNIGNLNFPHSISKLFRVENDLYSFVANVNSNTITRLKFSGCNSASISSSTEQNPDPVTYSVPGTYNINLTTDDGLPTQGAFCKQVVVLPNVHTPLQRTIVCDGDSVLLTSSNATGNQWNTGSTASSIYARTVGAYWVQSTNASGCVNIDSFDVSLTALPTVNLGKDSSLCQGNGIVLNAGNAGATYSWQDGQTTQTVVANKPGLYSVIVTKDGCIRKDSIVISILLLPVVNISGNNTICKDGTTTLEADGGVLYSWSPAAGLSNPLGASTAASPTATTEYKVVVTGQNGCIAKDSVIVTVEPRPVFTASASKPVLCKGDTATLTATGGDIYTWSPALSLSSPASNTTLAYPANSTQYKVVIEERNCQVKDSLFVNLPVATKPNVVTTKSNDINCFIGEATLHAGGGSQYLWTPAIGLSDATSSNPVVRINATTTYHLFVTTTNGCLVEDSIIVYVLKGDDGSGFPVPNAFTPNSDGKNDCFEVKYWGDVSEFSLNIYNRWGERLFHADNPTQCWNGVYKGQRQPDDVYVYWIRAKTRCGNVFRKGTFALIR